jgi:hypothetical protein
VVNTDDVHDPPGLMMRLGPLGGTRLLALGPAVLWLACGLLATAAATGLLVLAPAIRRRSQAAWLAGGGDSEPDNEL